MIEVRDLEVGYFVDMMAIRGLSMRAPQGKITAVIGANGAGKSTLLKTVYGYLRPRRGSVLFDGQDITGSQPYTLLQKGMAFLPQERTVFPELTVQENLEMGGWLIRHKPRLLKEAMDSVYQRFPALQGKVKEKAKALSGGLQRMLELGRALLVSPRALLVDEPTVGMAPLVAAEIYETLKGFSRSGITVLLVDQNVNRALELADYVFLLERGVVMKHGPKEEFLETAQPLRDLYLGGTAA